MLSPKLDTDAADSRKLTGARKAQIGGKLRFIGADACSGEANPGAFR
jgi:hypothetical protein